MDCASFISRWKKWIRFAVIIIYIILLVIAVPLCIWELEQNKAPDHVQAWFIGGMFVLMALPISFWGILQHVINYTTPYLQRHIIRILWMVPVYALNAWFALRFPKAAIYLDTLRECYEAYVIYNFMAYLLSFLHHDHPDLSSEVEDNSITFVFPLCFLPPCKNGSKFMQHCKHGVLQYTLVRPIMAAIAFICEMCGKYDEGDFNFKSAWSYIVVISNLSQIFAMYCLVMFYRAFRQELKPLKPVPKFLCVKAVVFLSFWQGLLIAALAKLNVIPSNGTWVFYDNIKEVSTGIQDFLICIEMFLAAVAHYFSFSHKPFVNPAAEQQNCCDSFLSMWDVRDVTGDVAEHARFLGRGMQKTLNLGKRLVARNDERTPLLSGLSSDLTSQQTTAAASSDGNIDSYTESFSSTVKANASMNNYAIFENSTENQLKGLSRSVSLQGYGSGEDENFEVLRTEETEAQPTHSRMSAGVLEYQQSSYSADQNVSSDNNTNTNQLNDNAHHVNQFTNKEQDLLDLDKAQHSKAEDVAPHLSSSLDTTENQPIMSTGDSPVVEVNERDNPVV
ncbi:transmembrane protein 184C [Biomphalaria pfeifferi]|uniref:Transmembrane protein 184C n=1 Tax=Biomphalaria pfeifferi TaxID=112525 RepID=A0AAD8BD88_BIOPF|nr:transmembrane protein 184C [Biomphalaria pfeifferi]